MLICSIAIENTTAAFDKMFDYCVPVSLHIKAVVGCRALVPFGRGNKLRQGMIMSVKTEESAVLKEIKSILDDTPIVTPEMLELCVYMKQHLFCTYYDAIKAMLPAGINYNITTLYTTASFTKESLENLPGEHQNVISFIKKSKTPVKKEKIMELFGYEKTDFLDKLVKLGFLTKDDSAFRKVSDATQKMVSLSKADDYSAIKLTQKQNSVMEILQSVGSVSVKELCYFTGVTISVVDALVKKGLAVYFDEEVLRTSVKVNNQKQHPLVLTKEQQTAYDSLLEKYKKNKANVSLLYGITGSGKTSVFMKLIQYVHSQNKGVIVMVPEIALTPQLVSLFTSVFGNDVAVFHSSLSLGERMDEYKRVLRGDAKIAVGTRSAVFAPFKELGLIIMDEEQEGTYKSENNPRFHARDIAKFRISKHNCLLLLSSATPDVETFHYAKTNRYSLVTLKSRYGGAVLPNVIVNDMNVEIQQGNTTGFSSLLLEEININLDNGEQSILLLNRRGHNTFVTCGHCNEPVTCPNCSISLTYHSANNRMMCHYCGLSVPYTDECPACHSKGLRYSGAGTQRAEQALYEFFSDARILRMDTDSTMSKSSHEKKLTAFAKGEYDILVGTQMVAKGLDFPNVTLVGVLNADQMLYMDDYRSYERAFSMLTQVVGRSGRGKTKGRAIIQTLTPENPIIDLAANQDYDKFFESEIQIRKSLLYPPFADMCMVAFVGENHQKTIKASRDFLNALIQLAKSEYAKLPMRVLGPSAAYVSKVNNKYRYKIIIKTRNNKQFREMLNRLINNFNSNKEFSSVTVFADMKPLYI